MDNFIKPATNNHEVPVIAVFGGTFDPIHNGHLFLAGELLRSGKASEVLFVPSANPPHKQCQATTAEIRLEMVKEAIENFDMCSVSDIEISRIEDFSYTFETMSMLKQIFVDCELRFLMGMDSLRDIHKWYRATELVSHFQFFIFPRPGVKAPNYAELMEKFGDRGARKLLDSILDFEALPISGSEIREIAAAGGSLIGLVPGEAIRIIKSNNIYGQSSSVS